MGLVNWFKKQAAAITLAMSNVEKNTFNQGGEHIEPRIGSTRRVSAESLAEALVKGEITQEVKNLRWRTYKVMQASEGLSSKIETILVNSEEGDKVISEDEDGNMIITGINTTKRKTKDRFATIKVDSFDAYPVELVVNNDEITKDMINSSDASNNAISYASYFSRNMSEKPIWVNREFMPKYELENYAKKLVVRKINNREKLLEFYVSKYPDENNMVTKMFIKEIKRVMESGPEKINFLQIKEVGFFTNKTLGASDFLAFGYEITGFDKIIEFDGNYVIKFKANITIEGESLLNKFREEKLDEKYANKEQKRVTI